MDEGKRWGYLPPSRQYGNALLGVRHQMKYIDDQPTGLASWKISNGHISSTGHPIHCVFGSRVGLSG